MVWFKVDDSFHSHPKATACSLAAIGLWTAAGSWSGDHLTDGFVPDHMIPQLSRSQIELAAELVAAGLWRRTKGGYRFHQWHADSDGTPRNPTREEVIASRSHRDATRQQKSSGGSLGNHRRWHVDRGVTNPDCRYCQQERSSDNRSDYRSLERSLTESAPNPSPVPDPTRPVVSGSVGDHPHRRNARGDEHHDDDDLEEKIIKLIHELTGRTITPDWAARVRDTILGGRNIRDPARYLAAAIRAAPRDHLPPDNGPPPVDMICDHGRDRRTCHDCRQEIP